MGTVFIKPSNIELIPWKESKLANNFLQIIRLVRRFQRNFVAAKETTCPKKHKTDTKRV